MRTSSWLACLCLGALAACTGQQMVTRSAPEFATLRARGLRIAVAPFACNAAAASALAATLAPLGDAFALADSEVTPTASQLAEQLHADVLAWLQQTDFEVVDPWQAATRWAHRGFTAAQQQDPGEAKALATTLDADAVLFGELERWDRSYFVVQSHAAVALSLRLVDATGRELCRTHQLATAGSGLSSGPTGYFALATEPLAGLRTAQLQELRRTAARSAVMALAGSELGAAVVATAPRLTLVGVAPHEPEFPLDQPLPPGTRLDLVAVGSPGCIVLCQLGRLRTGITLRETELHHDPRGDRATYQGHYVVQRGDQAADLPVMATIERGVQRRSVRTEYRWRGTLRLGAVPVANR